MAAPTTRYDTAARRRVAFLACRQGGPELEVGTGPRARMATLLASCGMPVPAVDQDRYAVPTAQRPAAAEEARGRLTVQLADAGHLPLAEGSYRVVVAFDCLGHAQNPKRVLAERFRVCPQDGVVLITEYNEPGRPATRHRNFGFERRLEKLLRPHWTPAGGPTSRTMSHSSVHHSEKTPLNDTLIFSTLF